MAEWRDRGYVPDSDDEEIVEDDPTKGSPGRNAPADRLQASSGTEVETTTTLAVRATDSLICMDSQPGSNAHETLDDCDMKDVHRDIDVASDLPGSTSEKLQAELEQGLRTVREVLTSAVTSDRENSNRLTHSLSSSSLSSLSSLASIEDIDLLSNLIEPLKDEVVEQHGQVEPAISYETRVRSLRQRNPIQLHPYLLENAQYQQQWLSRGLRPVRVEPTQAPAPDAEAAIESQEQDSYRNNLETEQSVVLSSQADESQSPIGQKRHRRINLQDLDADQIPDLTALLEGDAAFVNINGDSILEQPSKHKTLKKRKNPAVSRVPQLPPPLQGNENSPYDVPPSPPLSGRIPSNMELESEVEDSTGHEADLRHGLPTPLVSSDRPAKRSYVEISDDGESEPSSSTTTLQPTKIPHNLENMRRRIRGVLPASWVKLDLQQSRHIAVSKDRQSSPEDVGRRGVARPIQSGNRQRSDHFPAWPDAALETVSSQDSPPHRAEKGIEELDYDDMNDLPDAGFFDNEAWDDNEFDTPFAAEIECLPSQDSNAAFHDRRRSTAYDWDDYLRHGLRDSKFSDNNPLFGSSRHAQKVEGASKPRKRIKKKASSVRQTILDAPDFLGHSPHSRARFMRVAARASRKRASRQYSKEYFQTTRQAGPSRTRRDLRHSGSTRHNPVLPVDLSVIVPGTADFVGAENQPLASPTSLLPKKPRELQRGISNTLTTPRPRSLAPLKSRDRLLHWSASLSTSREDITSSQATAAQPSSTQFPSGPLFQRHQQSGVLDRSSITPRQADYQALKGLRVSMPPYFRFRPPGPNLPYHFNYAHHQIDQTYADAPGQSPSLDPVDNEQVQVSLTRAKLTSFRSLVNPTRERASEMSRRIIRKLLPRRRNVEQHLPQTSLETFAHDSELADVDSDLSAACNILTNMSRLTPGTRCNPDSLTGRHLVAKALRPPNRAATLENNLSTQTGERPTEDLNISAMEGSNETIEDSTFSTIRLLNEISVAINPSLLDNVVPRRYWSAKDKYDFITAKLDQILIKLDGSALPLALLLNVLMRIIDCTNALIHFLTSIEAGQDAASDICALRVLNRLIAIIYPLCALVRSQEGEMASAMSAQKTLFECTRLIFTILCTEHVLRRLESILTRNRGSTETAPVLDNAPEIDAILLCHHINEKLDNEEWFDSFNSTLESAMETQTSESKAHILPRMTKLLALMCPLLELDEYGLNASTGAKHCYWAWKLLVPNIESYLKGLIDSTIYWGGSVNVFITSLLEWCYKLVRVWGWPRPLTLVQALLRVYNSNGTKALVPNVRNPIDWDKLSRLSDPSLDLAVGDTDFDIYLKLVGLALSMTNDGIEASDPRMESRMRSLVWSLCPNTGRLLPGDEQLEREKLSTFVNHCRLYVVLSQHAPKNCKPRLSIFENLAMLADAHMSVWHALTITWHLLVMDIIGHAVDIDIERLDNLMSYLMIMVVQMNNRSLKMVAQIRMPAEFTDQVKALNGDVKLVYGSMKVLLKQWRQCLSSSQNIHQFQNVLMVHRWPILWRACKPIGLAFFDVLMAGFDHIARLPENVETCDLLIRLFRDIFGKITVFEANVRIPFLQSLASAWVSFAGSSVRSRFRSWDDFLHTHSPVNPIRLIPEPLFHEFSTLVWLTALQRQPQLYEGFESQIIDLFLQCLVKVDHEASSGLHLVDRCMELATASRRSMFYGQKWQPLSGASRTLAVIYPLYITKIIDMLATAATNGTVRRDDVRLHLKALGHTLQKECESWKDRVVGGCPLKDLEVLISEVQAFVEGLRRNDITYVDPDESMYEFLGRHLGVYYVNMIRTPLTQGPPSLRTTVGTLLAATQMDAVQDIEATGWASNEQPRRCRAFSSPLKSHVSLAFYIQFPRSPHDLQRDFASEFKYIRENFRPYLEAALCDPYFWLSRSILPLLREVFANPPTVFSPSEGVRRYTATYFECAFSVLESVIKALKQTGTTTQHPAIRQIGDNSAMQDNFMEILRLSHAVIVQFAEVYTPSSSSSPYASKYLDNLYEPFKLLSAWMKQYFSELDDNLTPAVLPLPVQGGMTPYATTAIQRSFTASSAARWTIAVGPGQALRFWKHGHRPGHTGHDAGALRAISKKAIHDFIQSVPTFAEVGRRREFEMIGELLDGVAVPTRATGPQPVIEEYEARFEE